MSTTPETTTSADQKLSQIRIILYLLQTHLDEFKGEVDRSYALLQIGEMTDLAKKIDGTISNPIGSLFEVSNNIDSQVKHILDILTKSFLLKEKELLHTVYRSKTSLNDLHYSIALKNDNIENRSKILEFFDKLDLHDVSNKYHVYFQFVPIELLGKLVNAEEVDFS